MKKVLLKCPLLDSLNLSSCRALPRGMKRLYTGKELQDLKDSFDPEKAKTKEESDKDKGKKKKDLKTTEADSKSEDTIKNSPKDDTSESSGTKMELRSQDNSSSTIFQEPKSVGESESNLIDKSTEPSTILSPSSAKTSKEMTKSPSPASKGKRSSRDTTPKLLSPPESKPDSSSTPRSEPGKTDFGSPHFSPVSKPDSQEHNSPEVHPESIKSNNWNLGQFKTTPTHKSEATPLSKTESHNKKFKHGNVVEQCSPTTSVDNKPSPEVGSAKQDSIKNPSSWNYGNYSPMPRQEFSSQRSPYSAQPSPAQPSPYSAQPSPYSAQPSPYSSQPSPYSAQPSPDTSQMVKPDLQKTGAWNTGSFSPMPKHHAPFSPHPSTHTSPDAGLGVKSDSLRNNSNKTPGQFSPMSRQDRLHQSPYSPRPSVENVTYGNKKSPATVGNYSPMMRSDCHLPDGGQTGRPVMSGRTQDIYNRSVTKVPEVIQNVSAPQDLPPSSWGMERYNQMSNAPAPSIESLVWGTQSFGTESSMQQRTDNIPAMLNTPPSQPWSGLPNFNTSARRPDDELSDPWTLGQFRVEPPQQMHNTFVEQNVSFESLSGHIGHPSQVLQNYLDDGYTETSRVD